MPNAVRAVLAATVVFALILPATASAAPAGFVGMTADDLYGNAGPYREKGLAQLEAAGVQSLRVTFNWEATEVAPQNFDFTVYDNYVRDAAAHNITLLPVLVNAPDFYSFNPGSRFFYQPKDNADMARWATLLVDRYGPNGTVWQGIQNPHPITAWQIWNEPNLSQYWYKKPNAAKYRAMLQTVGGAIKSRDPSAEIVTAGMPDSFQKSAIRLEPYLKALYKRGGTNYIDTVAINSYAVSPKSLGNLLTKTRKILNRIGGRSDKIWVTEVGWCDKGVKHRFCVGT